MLCAHFKTVQHSFVEANLIKGAFSSFASISQTPVCTSIPALRNCSMPLPLLCCEGSIVATTTFPNPASIIACVQGLVFPWWQHGSSVTYIVALRGLIPSVLQSSRAVISAWASPNFLCQPLPIIWLPFTIIQPTAGFGSTLPIPRFANRSAICIYFSSMSLILSPFALRLRS